MIRKQTEGARKSSRSFGSKVCLIGATSLRRWLCAALHCDDVIIDELRPLHGGALHRHDLIALNALGGKFPGSHLWVLRRAASTTIPWGLDCIDEFALMSRLHQAGVFCPKPRLVCDDPRVIGAAFMAMDFVPGETNGVNIVRKIGGVRAGGEVCRALGRELACIHATGMQQSMPDDSVNPLDLRLRDYHNWCMLLGSDEPVLAFALQWLEQNRPMPRRMTTIHGDFRTGNFVIDSDGLRAILDFEFAGQGDPREDIGWLTMRYWRFGNDENLCGGLAPLSDFMRGYRDGGGEAISSSELVFFQVLANIRWALIATMQWNRYAIAGERNLDLILSGHVRPHVFKEILRLIETGEP